MSQSQITAKSGVLWGSVTGSISPGDEIQAWGMLCLTHFFSYSHIRQFFPLREKVKKFRSYQTAVYLNAEEGSQNCTFVLRDLNSFHVKPETLTLPADSLKTSPVLLCLWEPVFSRIVPHRDTMICIP